MTYAAHVVKIEKIIPIANADNIVIGVVLGNQVIVSKAVSCEGDIGVYFPVDGQLSQEFCDANDLIVRKDENGKKINSGYFSDKRRVTAQRFLGVKSEGFFVPLSFFDFVDNGTFPLHLGDTFTELYGVPICGKYYSPQTMRQMEKDSNKPNKIEKVKINFPKHFDTEQFRFAKDRIQPDSRIIITEKLHGVSVRYANTTVEYILPWYKKLLNKVYPFFVVNELRYLLGSRNVIIGQNPKDKKVFYGGFYGDGEPYNKVAELLYGKLNEEEIIYGELVGFIKGKPAFEHDLTKTKELAKQFKTKNMIYSYGMTSEMGCDFYVYRITQDGHDLSWNKVKTRCNQLNIKPVPEMNHITLDNMADNLEAVSTLDNNHISEGFCIREEFFTGGMKIYKEKAFNFRVLEGHIKEQDDTIDMEEVS